MRRIPVLIIAFLMFTAALTIGGCGRAAPAPKVVDPASADWLQIVEAARGSTVRFYMWGGSDTINRWIDGYVTNRMEELYGVRMQRTPMNAPDFINKLLTERQAGQTRGSIDLVWINGENFKAARQGDLLWGPFAERLPNYQSYVDHSSADVTTDFGSPVDGYEAPWGRAQFVLTYDSARVPEPPQSFAALAEWVRRNPGRFTYPAPPDFTGSAFTRMALYETTGGYEQYLTGYDESLLTKKWQATWDLLSSMGPYLWLKGETYPESLARLNQLYADGEVWMTMSYDPAEASNMVLKAVWPQSTRTLVFERGTIGNTHFTAIPFNAANVPGAMVLANFLLSPEAQINKQDPVQWGDFMAIDPGRLPAEDRARLDALARGPATLSPDVLAAHRVPEIGAEYVRKLEAGWREHVARGQP